MRNTCAPHILLLIVVLRTQILIFVDSNQNEKEIPLTPLITLGAPSFPTESSTDPDIRCRIVVTTPSPESPQSPNYA